MSNPIIETDLVEILNKLDGRFDKLDNKIEKIDNRLNNLEVGQAQIKTDVENIKKEISELKTSQKNQIWALIILAFTAVVSLSESV